MDPSSAVPSPPAAGPRAEYERRRADFRDQQARAERRLAWLGNTRFVLLAAGAILFGVTVIAQLASPWWLAVPVVVFLVLTFFFERASRRAGYAARAAAFYERGLARLDGRWAGTGVAGTEYLDEEHLYAADLDVFGRGSLFERLCEAQTRDGRDTLARWLRAPATPEEIGARQAAVRELRDRLPWRERLALLGGAAGAIDTAALAAWGTAAGRPVPWARWLALCLAAVTVLTLAALWAGWVSAAPPALALLVQIAFALALRPRVRRAL